MTHARHAHGPLVRALREAHGWTLADLGAEADLDPGYLSRVERGDHRRASVEATARIATAFDVDPAVLTGQVPPYRTLRTRLSTWTVDQLAGLIGVDPDDLEAFEQGTAVPPAGVQWTLAHRFGVSTDALLSSTAGAEEQTTCPA